MIIEDQYQEVSQTLCLFPVYNTPMKPLCFWQNSHKDECGELPVAWYF